MNDFQTIVTFAEKYGVEVFVFGLIACALTQVVKKVLPEKLKDLTGILPFLISGITYSVYSAIFLSSFNLSFIFNKGIQAGGIATLCYLFFKQLFLNKGNLHKAISDLLKGILSTKTISKVVTLITKEYSTEISEEELILSITEILKENTDISDDVLQAVAKLVQQTIDKKGK